jgi:hypothetical protein
LLLEKKLNIQERQMSKEFLENMSRCDSLTDHEDKCGMCEHQRIMAQVARDLLADENLSINEWSIETKKRWSQTKYYKLWQEAVKNGNDPYVVFEDNGWEP